MANRLLYTNVIKTAGGTLSAQSEAAGYDATNLQTDNYGEVYRSTAAGATTEWAKVDLGSAQTVDTVFLGNVNFRTSATIVVEGHTSDSWGTPDVQETIDCGALGDERRNLFHPLASSQSKRWWRVTMVDNGNPDGYLQIGEWMLGAGVTLDEALDATNTRTRLRDNVELRTEYGQAYVYTRDWRWMFDLGFSNATATNKDQIRALDLAVQGNGFPFVFVWNDTDPAESYYVRMADSNLSESQVHYNVYSQRIRMIEESPGLAVPRS